MMLSTRLRRLAVVLPLLWGAESVRADDGIPALLQFAEKYSSRHKEAFAPLLSQEQVNQPAAGRQSESHALQRTLKERELQLTRLQTTLQQQEEALVAETARRVRAEEALQGQSKMADWTPLRKLLSELHHSVTGMFDQKRANATIARAKESARREQAAVRKADEQIVTLKEQISLLTQQLQEGEAKNNPEQSPMVAQLQTLKQQLEAEQAQQNALKLELKKLQEEQKGLHTALVTPLQEEKIALGQRLAQRDQQLTELEKQVQELQQVKQQKEASLLALQQENKTYKDQKDKLTRQLSEGEAELARQSQKLHQAQSDADGLRSRATLLAKPQMLKEPEQKQAYAAGDALGRDILTLLNQRKGWGVNADRQVVLAGVVDAFAGKYQLSADELSRALADSEQAVDAARKKMTISQQKSGEDFLAQFKKQKGVKQSPSGFLYRVDYAGDTPLQENDIVDVVVKETLTDGTVIQDMSLTSNVLSQPLKAYPPLFRDAMSYIKNHGSLTMVVPAGLAYGAEGYPPKVPPNATMVYELRIDNSHSTHVAQGH